MTKFIINADDFGYSRGVNYGIIDAHNQGVLTSTTLMVTMPAVKHAVALMKDHPTLAVGLHLNLSFKKPLTSGKSLVCENGEFIKPVNLTADHAYDSGEIWIELNAQYDEFVKLTGIHPTHMDSHLGSHLKVPSIKEMAIRLSTEKKIPLRGVDLDHAVHVDFIEHRTFATTWELDYILRNFNKILKHDFVEIMCHPAYVDDYVMKNSSHNLQRVEELKFLMSDEFINAMKSKDVKLVTYREAMKEGSN